MNKKTFERICKEKNLNPADIEYNLGWNVEDLKLYGGKIYKPAYLNKYFKFEKKFEIILEDCI